MVQLTKRVCAAVPFAILSLSGVAQAQLSSTSSAKGHPRIWLDETTLSGLRSDTPSVKSAVARGSERCEAAQNDPADYSMGGWQGFEFTRLFVGLHGLSPTPG